MTRILVIGGTGKIGRHLVTASLNAGHPTAVLVRPATVAADPAKASLLEVFKARGASLVWGDINVDGEVLVAAIKQAGDVVISAVGYTSPEEVESQLRIVAAMNEAGNVKRFLPSEYGCDVEVVAHTSVEPLKSILGAKLRVRQALRASGIPYTIICSFWVQAFLLPMAGNPQANGPPAPDTTATIFGDGQGQVFVVSEDDMSRVAMRAVEDPRALNKILHVRPPGNLCSLSQLVSLWEKKIGKPLHRRYVATRVPVPGQLAAGCGARDVRGRRRRPVPDGEEWGGGCGRHPAIPGHELRNHPRQAGRSPHHLMTLLKTQIFLSNTG